MNASSIVILPTYNEAENLKVLLPKLRPYEVDVLVVDDSPDDVTAQVAQALGCLVLRRINKRGRVSALLEGIAMTAHERIITMDADLQHPPETVPAILEALDRSDVVVASRNVPGGSYQDFTLKRKAVSSVAKLLAWPLTPRLKDRSSGFVAFHRGVLNGARLPLGFGTLVLGILVMGKYNTFEEVPYTFGARQKGQSKLTRKVIVDHLVQLGRLYLYKFPILKFMLVGGSGAVIGLSLLYILTSLLGLYYLMSYAIAFIVSVTNNYLWNSLWTFRQRRGVIGWVKYVGIYIITLTLNTTLMYVLTDLLQIWYMLSAVLVALAVFLVNYLVSRRIVWQQR